MQKWEYMTASCWIVNVNGRIKGTVLAISGQPIGELGKNFKIQEGEPLEHFLNRVGTIGWDVVSTSSLSGSYWINIILKRPLEEI